MRELLEPLSKVPGVRTAVLVSCDGVPIAVQGDLRCAPEGLDQLDWIDAAEDLNALAALAAGWQNEIARAVGPMSWDAPRRVTLKASRGTLVMVHASGVLLLVMLEGSMRDDELRIPMEGVIARLQRKLRSMGRRTEPEPPGIFPARRASGTEGGAVETSGAEAPEVSGGN